MMSDLDVASPGRPIRLVPTAPGFWMVVLGVSVAALAPLFGFLVGSMVGPAEEDALFSPLYVGLFVGVIIGGLGVLSTILGGRRLYLDSKAERRA